MVFKKYVVDSEPWIEHLDLENEIEDDVHSFIHEIILLKYFLTSRREKVQQFQQLDEIPNKSHHDKADVGRQNGIEQTYYGIFPKQHDIILEEPITQFIEFILPDSLHGANISLLSWLIPKGQNPNFKKILRFYPFKNNSSLEFTNVHSSTVLNSRTSFSQSMGE